MNVREFIEWTTGQASDEDLQIVMWRAGVLTLEELIAEQNVSKTIIYKRLKKITNNLRRE